MSKQLQIIDTTTDTFYSWIIKTNGIINLVNTEVVTANTSTLGATTIGKGYVIGTFGANTLVTDVIQAGNTTVNGSVLTVVSNSVFSNSQIRVDNGVFYGANSTASDTALKVTTTGTTQQVVDTFPTASYRTAKYVVSITDGVSQYQCTEIMLMHDGTNTYSTEYATIISNTALATFSSDVTTGNCRLLITPTVSALQVSVQRSVVSV